MRITSKGQVTIPLEIRRKLGMLPGTEVEFRVEGGAVKILRRKGSLARGWRIVEHMKGRGSGTMTTDEILALMRGDE
jgi:AbrB family looped-hinge helix DNA binding protein